MTAFPEGLYFDIFLLVELFKNFGFLWEFELDVLLFVY